MKCYETSKNVMKCYEIIAILVPETQNRSFFFAVPDFITFWRAGEKTYRREVMAVRKFYRHSIRNDVFGGLAQSLPSDFAHRPKCYENVMKYFIT